MRAMVVLAARAVIVSSLIAASMACSDKPDSEAGGAKVETARPKTDTPGVVSTDMVGAVSAGKSAVPVDVRFDHARRPELGVPLDLVVSVVPTAAIERLQVVFQAQEGIRVTANSNLGPVERPPVGSEIRHVVTVTPVAEGVYTVAAVVLIESTDVSMSRSFAIPLVIAPAADGAAALAGSAGAPAADKPEKGARSP